MKWLGGLCLVAGLFFFLVTLGGPYTCSACGERLTPRHYGASAHYFCGRCDIEWVASLVSARRPGNDTGK